MVISQECCVQCLLFGMVWPFVLPTKTRINQLLLLLLPNSFFFLNIYQNHEGAIWLEDRSLHHTRSRRTSTSKNGTAAERSPNDLLLHALKRSLQSYFTLLYCRLVATLSHDRSSSARGIGDTRIWSKYG